MKISFLVTYYNQKQYVEQSIESILAIEKPCEWEILVGDDGSSDGTQEVVLEYARKYPEHITLHIMPRNPAIKYVPVQRASANRLKLLEESTGDYYCILDGDDYYCDKYFVREALSVLNEQADISAVLFGYKYVVNGVEAKSFTLPEHWDQCKIDKGEYLNYYYTPSGACVYRNPFDVDKMNYLKQIGFYDDNNIVINSMNFGELYYINRVIYGYRQTNTSTFNSMNFLEQAVLNVQGYDVDKKMIEDQYQNDLLKRNAVQILIMYIWRKDLRRVLGEQKYVSYLHSCERLGDSLAYSLLNYNQLNTRQRQTTNNIVFAAAKLRPKFALKMFLKRLIAP